MSISSWMDFFSHCNDGTFSDAEVIVIAVLLAVQSHVDSAVTLGMWHEQN